MAHRQTEVVAERYHTAVAYIAPSLVELHTHRFDRSRRTGCSCRDLDHQAEAVELAGSMVPQNLEHCRNYYSRHSHDFVRPMVAMMSRLGRCHTRHRPVYREPMGPQRRQMDVTTVRHHHDHLHKNRSDRTRRALLQVCLVVRRCLDYQRARSLIATSCQYPLAFTATLRRLPPFHDRRHHHRQYVFEVGHQECCYAHLNHVHDLGSHEPYDQHCHRHDK